MTREPGRMRGVNHAKPSGDVQNSGQFRELSPVRAFSIFRGTYQGAHRLFAGFLVHEACSLSPLTRFKMGLSTARRQAFCYQVVALDWRAPVMAPAGLSCDAVPILSWSRTKLPCLLRPFDGWR